MDPITHTLSGIVLTQLLPVGETRFAATATVAIAANLPDVDAFLRRLKSTAFIEYHHSLTHSLLGMLILSSMFSIAWTPIIGLSFATVFALSIMACLVHTAGDLLIHIYKIPLLFPFSRRKFGANILIGLNPMTSSARCGERSLWVCTRCQLHSASRNPVLIILASSVLMGLITRKMFVCSISAAGLILLYLTLVLILRHNARTIFLRYLRGTEQASLPRLHIYPASFMPFKWLCVAEQTDRYLLTSLDLLRPVLPVCVTCFSKYSSHPLVKTSRETETVQSFLKKAFHPHPTVEHNDRGILVKWKDLAYAFDLGVDLFTARVQVSGDGTLISQEFRERW